MDPDSDPGGPKTCGSGGSGFGSGSATLLETEKTLKALSSGQIYKKTHKKQTKQKKKTKKTHWAGFFDKKTGFFQPCFKASPTLDHKLKWDLFRLPELECFDAMLNRLFRDELEELVMRYEGIRCAISQEMELRACQANRQAACIIEEEG